MAASFKVLRQYEKIGLIILGVVVMVMFTMGDFFSYSNRNVGDAGTPKGARVVSWNGGSLTQGQVERIMEDHRSVIDVEQEILQKIASDKKNPGQPKVQPIMAAAGEELVNRYIFSTYAANLGLQVDDEAVRTFLKKLSGDRMSMSEIKTILDDVIGDSPEARTRFFNWTRRELASKAVERMILSAQTGVAPEGAWDQFKGMMQRAQIEFIALPTTNYLDKVKDKPSPAELKALYEELKNRYRQFDRPGSGIRQPEELAFEWVKADIKPFLDEEKAKVTDEQVKEYYEKNKNSYKKPKKPPVQPPKTDAEGEKKAEGTAEPEKGTEKDPSKPEGEQPATPEKGETPPADPNAPTPESTEPKSTDPAETPKDPAAEKPAGEPATEPAKPADPPKSDEPAETPKDAGESVSLVSFVAQDAPAQDPSPGQEPAKEQEPKKPDEEKPAEVKPAEEKAADQEKKPEEKPVDAPAGQEKPAEEKPSEDPAAQPEDEFESLETVADRIRTDLASKPAEDRFNQAIKEAEAELSKLWKKVTLGEGKIDRTELKKFDLKAFAGKYQFTSGTIPLSPPDKVMKQQEIGKYPGFINQAYFADKSMLYEPRIIKGNQFLSNDAYIYWRTEEKPEYEPKFEECEEELREAFRYRKAKEFARDDAKSKVAQVKAGKTLKETFPKENVLVTGQFSYKSPFSQGAAEIPEIPGAGEQFLSEVFKMKEGETKEIPLADESEYYVVQLTKFGFTEKELREQFTNFPIIAELAQAADAQENQTRIAAYREFLEALEVKFEGQTNAEDGEE